MNDDSNASSPAIPTCPLSTKTNPAENGTQNHHNPTKRKHEETEDNDNGEENGTHYYILH